MSEENTPHPVDVHVGLRMRLARKHKSMSQQTLAEALGVSFQQVQKYEKGTNRVSSSMLWDAAGALGVSPGWFFDGLPAPGETQDPEEHGVRQFANTPLGHKLLVTAMGMAAPLVEAHLVLMGLQSGALWPTPNRAAEDPHPTH